jgi:hypothetical protein
MLLLLSYEEHLRERVWNSRRINAQGGEVNGWKLRMSTVEYSIVRKIRCVYAYGRVQ